MATALNHKQSNEFLTQNPATGFLPEGSKGQVFQLARITREEHGLHRWCEETFKLSNHFYALSTLEEISEVSQNSSAPILTLVDKRNDVYKVNSDPKELKQYMGRINIMTDAHALRNAAMIVALMVLVMALVIEASGGNQPGELLEFMGIVGGLAGLGVLAEGVRRAAKYSFAKAYRKNNQQIEVINHLEVINRQSRKIATA